MTNSNYFEEKKKTEVCDYDHSLEEFFGFQSIFSSHKGWELNNHHNIFVDITYQNLPYPRGVLGLDPYFQLPPYRVGLVDLGGESGLNFLKFTRKLNSLQNTFHYGKVSTVTELGIKDVLHGYSYENLFNMVQSHIEGTDFKFGVGIIHERLEQDAFNHHSIDQRVGIISLRDFEEYIPFGRSKEQYLAYLLLCESFCIVGGVEFEHPEERDCLFDFCRDKLHFRQCMESAKIDKYCQAKLLREGGFKPIEIEKSKKILDYAARINLKNWVNIFINNSITGFFIGGLLINLLSTKISKLYSPWPTLITIFLLFGFICSIISPLVAQYCKRKRSGYKIG